MIYRNGVVIPSNKYENEYTFNFYTKPEPDALWELQVAEDVLGGTYVDRDAARQAMRDLVEIHSKAG